MTRAITPEKAREYAELSAFLGAYATHFLGIDPASESHPINTGQRIAEAIGQSKALIGLRQAVSDSVEELRALDPEQTARLDALLRAGGIVTLTELRRRYSRQFKALLRRGSLRDESDYYLANGMLSDCAEALSPEESGKLSAMVLAFERAVTGG